MALIKIDTVSVSKAENNAIKQNYLYKDLFLDVKKQAKTIWFISFLGPLRSQKTRTN